MSLLHRAAKLSLALAMAATWAGTAHAQTTPSCQFGLGFKTLHDMDAADVGDCLDSQVYVANGDAQQHTSKGLLVWRKADNWTAFTNGYKTWINGPQGLVSRLNTDHFPWEATPAPAPAPSPSPAPTSDSANSLPINTGGPCVKQVGAQVKHDLGPFYRIDVQALDAKNAPVPGAYGSYTTDYASGYWPLYDITDSKGTGWNVWQVIGAKSPVNLVLSVSSGGCVATTTVSFPLA